MIGILNNNLNIIPNITKRLEDIISCFWQPSMSKDYYTRKEETKYQVPKREIDKRKHLCLANIMVLRIGLNNSYMITMLGLKQSNCDDRVLLCNGKKEKAIIEKCLQDNLELERTSVLNYMTSADIELYNSALQIGNYEYCLEMLRGLELYINTVHNNKELQLTKKKKGE